MKIRRSKLTLAILSYIILNSNAVSAEEIINIPEQTFIMSLEEWNNRTVKIIGAGDKNILVYGGKKEGKFNPTPIDENNNVINFFGGYYDGINAGEVVDVTGNVMDISDGADGWITYSDAEKYNDEYNRLYIYGTGGGALTVNVIAGHGGLGAVSENVINFYGGNVTNYLIAAESKTSAADDAAERLINNVVNIFSAYNLTKAKIYGAALYDDSDKTRAPLMATNNTLNIYAKDIEVAEMTAFNNLNFYLPQDTAHEDLILNVTGDAKTDIGGSNVLAVVTENSPLDVNEYVILLQNGAGISDNGETTYSGIHADTGSSRGYTRTTEYHLEVEKVDDEHVILKLVGDRLRTTTAFVSQVRVPNIINRTADLLAGGGLADAESAGAQIYTPFFSATQSSLKQKTGSHIDTDNFNIIVGVSRKFDNEKRRRLIAPAVEYGFGKYDSYADGGIKGNGNTRHIGGGIVFRDKLNDGAYYEGSLRAGRTKADYETNSYTFKNQFLRESFKTSSPYFGAHFGAGREVQCNDKETFNYYGKFFYTYIGSDNVTLTTGENFKLSHVNSYRLRAGARYTYQFDKKNKMYTGLAYEYEFDGSSYGIYNGFRTPKESTRGGSGMLELGWIYKPENNDRWSIDLSCVGWLGRMQGLSGRLGVNWLF